MKEKHTKTQKYAGIIIASVFAVIAIAGAALQQKEGLGSLLFADSQAPLEVEGNMSYMHSFLEELKGETESKDKKEKDEAEDTEESKEEEQQPETKSYSTDLRQMHLPLQNSAPRGENTVTHAMIHFMSDAARNPQNPYDINAIYDIFVVHGFSAHYVIDRAGTIYEMVPENRIAYHAGTGRLSSFPQYTNRLNNHSIGIELLAIGTREEMAGLISASAYNSLNPEFIGYTDAQYNALALLLEDIYERHPNIKRNRSHVVGHDEYAPGRKTDPGSLFDWSRIGL